jgi:hypothetical protein
MDSRGHRGRQALDWRAFKNVGKLDGKSKVGGDRARQVGRWGVLCQTRFDSEPGIRLIWDVIRIGTGRTQARLTKALLKGKVVETLWLFEAGTGPEMMLRTKVGK